MKKLLLLLTLFLPLIAMESDQPKKTTRLRTTESGKHAFQPTAKRRKAIDRHKESTCSLSETEPFTCSFKMSLVFLTQQAPRTNEPITYDPAIEESALIEETATISAPIIKSKRKSDLPVTIERPYTCEHPGCKQSFTRKDNLKTHMLTHTGEKPYPCTWPGCDKSFAYKSILITHMRIHTGERPYLCTWPGCDKSFAQRPHLIAHIRTHTGEKSYPCTWPGCAKSFASSSNLATHIRTHRKPFKCHHCDSAFSYEAGLQKHIKKEHSTEN